MTLQLVETVTLTSAASSIEFTSIPQDGVDLLLKVSARSNDTSPFVAQGLFNNDTGANYSFVNLNGNGSTVLSSGNTISNFRFLLGTSDFTANTFASSQIYISNYTSTTNKSFSQEDVIENNASTAYQYLFANSYSTTLPITSIQLIAFSPDSFVAGSTASLYKVS